MNSSTKIVKIDLNDDSERIFKIFCKIFILWYLLTLIVYVILYFPSSTDFFSEASNLNYFLQEVFYIVAWPLFWEVFLFIFINISTGENCCPPRLHSQETVFGAFFLLLIPIIALILSLLLVKFIK